MTNSEIDELLAGLLAIDEDVPTAPVADMPVPLSPSEIALIEELNAVVRGEWTANSAPKIVAGARQIEMDFRQASKADVAIPRKEGRVQILHLTPPLHQTSMSKTNSKTATALSKPERLQARRQPSRPNAQFSQRGQSRHVPAQANARLPVSRAKRLLGWEKWR